MVSLIAEAKRATPDTCRLCAISQKASRDPSARCLTHRVADSGPLNDYSLPYDRLLSGRLNASEILNEFYITNLAYHTMKAKREQAGGMFSSPSREKFFARLEADYLEFLRQTSNTFEAYLTVAVIGEARHVISSTTEGRVWMNEGRFTTGKFTERTVKLLTEYQIMGKFVTLSNGVKEYHGGARNDAQCRALKWAQNQPVETVRQVLEFVLSLFRELSWGSSVGGPAWKRIAQTLLDYRNEKLTREIFIDRVFDLKHNGGRLFDKHESFYSLTSDNVIISQLDQKMKARDLKELHAKLSQCYKVAPQLTDLLQRGSNLEAWAF